MDKSIDALTGRPWHGAGHDEEWSSPNEHDPIVGELFYIKCAEDLYENITAQIVQKNPGIKLKPKWSDCPQGEKDMWITAVEQTLPGLIEHILMFSMANARNIDHMGKEIKLA